MHSKYFLPFIGLLVVQFNLQANQLHPYLSGELSQDTISNSISQPVISYYDNQINDAYPLNKNRVNTTQWSVHSGYEWQPLSSKWIFSAGIGFYNDVKPYTRSGAMDESILGDNPTHLYDYELQGMNRRLMFETSALYAWNNHLFGYADAGVGRAWNKLYGYQETVATPDGFVALAPFQDNTTTNIAYQFGGGLGYAFNLFSSPENSTNRERLSMGYRFVNLGKAALNIRDNTYAYPLDFGTLKAQEWYCRFTYLFS